MAIRSELEDLIGDTSVYGPLDIPTPIPPLPVIPTASTPAKPEPIAQLETMLDDFGWRVVTNAGQVRHLITNKLLALSDHPDPKIQLRAVELIGKIADIGMFVDKQEITLKHTSDEELQKRLREKLGLVIEAQPPEIADIEAISHTVITPKDIKIPFV